jgi:prophage DNA circulation protein
MAWRDQLQKGSFRGAPFCWQRADGELGRKFARHDYPQRDDCYIEDLGKAPREFTLEVYVLGDDYMGARDRLIAAFETAGPGTLVHPTMGTMSVGLNGKVRLCESTEEGGMARFTCPFVLAGPNKYPTSSIDTAGNVSDKSSAAITSSSSSFAAKCTTVNRPVFLLGSLTGQVTAMTAQLQAFANRVFSLAALPGYLSDLQNLTQSVGDLVRAPLDLAGRVNTLFNNLGNISGDPLTAFGLCREMFYFGSDFPAVPLITVNRKNQAANQAALIAMVRTAAVTAAAVYLSQVDFASFTEAAAARDNLLDAIDDLLNLADDDVYQDLSDLRSAVVADFAATSADLSRIVSWTPPATLPALVIAQILYGDATRADDIVSRNKVAHPGFVPGGILLEVLADA